MVADAGAAVVGGGVAAMLTRRERGKEERGERSERGLLLRNRGRKKMARISFLLTDFCSRAEAEGGREGASPSRNASEARPLVLLLLLHHSSTGT